MGTPELIAVGIFLLIVLIVVGPYYIFVVRPETATQEMLRQRIRTGGSAGGVLRPIGAGLLKEVEKLSVIGPLHKLLSGSGTLATALRRVIHHSGAKVTPGQLVLGSACLGVASAVFFVGKIPVFWAAVGAGVLVGLIPFSVLRFMANRRIAKFEEQFPEAVDLIGRTLRAGHAFTTGLRFASEELPDPVASEFKLLYDQQTFGLPLTDGLKAFAQRVPIMDAKFFVTAVLTQMEAGGNLAEVLDNLTQVIRERFKIKRELRTLTAHGRMTGLVLAGLPPCLALYMFYKMPDHLNVLLTDPLGKKMIIVAIFLQIAGAWLIKKISDVKY
jgi:tight adherence protein B